MEGTGDASCPSLLVLPALLPVAKLVIAQKLH